MNNDIDSLLQNLDDEIDRKCFEIKRRKAEKRLQKFFLAACLLFLTAPFLHIFAGVDLITLFIPVALFLAITLLAISPILLNNKVGGVTP